MRDALAQFNSNLLRAKELGCLASWFINNTTQVFDVSDMWRSQIVLAVSALDHFVHELTRFGMVEIAKGVRKDTESYKQFQIPLSAAMLALRGEPAEEWIGETVRQKHSWLSFEHPDKIADAIRIISSKPLWDVVGSILNKDVKDVKTRLQLIVARRNKITHEADIDPINPNYKWPIDESQAMDSIDFIQKVGNAIYKVVNNEIN